jgi:hypothetical protein
MKFQARLPELAFHVAQRPAIHCSGRKPGGAARDIVARMECFTDWISPG